MKWNDYAYQPIGHVLRRKPAADLKAWLSGVHHLGLMRVFGDDEPNAAGPRLSSEAALGAYFRPDATIDLALLQVAGLLLKRNRLDRQSCALSARRHGGGLYFKWFLAQIDASVANPLPSREFPLHSSRWRKRKAG